MKPKNLLNLVFSVSISLLIILSFISYSRTSQIERYSYWVDHTYNVMLESERVFSLMKGTISSQRGFLLTNDSLFYTTYLSESKIMDASLIKLKALVYDNPSQVSRIKNLEKLVEKRKEEFNLSFTKKSLTNNDVSYLKKIILVERNITNEIEKIILNINSEERKLMEDRLDSRERIQKVTPNFLLITSALAMIFLGFTYYALNKELRKRLVSQKDLELKISELHRSNDELEQFAYVASHDLQEPLRKIRAFSDRLILKHKDALIEDGKMMLEKIQSSAERMQKLIDDLLNFSRMVKNIDELESVDLNILLKGLMKDMGEPIADYNAVINVSSLPIISAYKNQIYQLFQNLISNSIKFSKLEISPVIDITYNFVRGSEINDMDISVASKGKEFHKITVSDNGIGFDQQFAEKIFIIFQRLHGKLEYEGTGIGLAICKRIIANHHGYITAKSKLNNGATFFIYLPIGNFRED